MCLFWSKDTKKNPKKYYKSPVHEYTCAFYQAIKQTGCDTAIELRNQNDSHVDVYGFKMHQAHCSPLGIVTENKTAAVVKDRR